jgi:nicotinamidase-related amidase
MTNVVKLRSYSNMASIPTLVLLDLQQDDAGSARPFSIPQAEAALENCRLALVHSRARGLPVAFLRMNGRSAHFDPASSYSSWIPGFEPLISEMVFERSKPSCYANREFAHAMTEAGGHFVLAGFSGEAGCLATAVEAFHRDHRVTFLADASASLGLNQVAATAMHEAVTQLIGLYGAVTTTRSWILEQTAGVSCLGG